MPDHLTRLAVACLLSASLLIGLAPAAAGQGVATLRTPGPEAAASEPPADEADEQEALLGFSACMRDNGIDFPDPVFGVGGNPFSVGALAGLDLTGSAFLDAVEACGSFLESLQPELDPEEAAEQREQQIAFATCMRGRGIDFPDPDPLTGYTIGSLRGEDGGLAFDPFSADFLIASGACVQELDLSGPGQAGDGP